MISRKKLSVAFLFCATIAIATTWTVRLIVERASTPYIASTCEELPFTRTAVVLGCSHQLSDGRVNQFFKHRISKAAELFHSRRVNHLIVSGDNSRADYNEPLDMKSALIELGVPADKISCDFAGFSTLDSIVRAKKVFGQNQIIVVSQEFHNMRAVYLARSKGIEAYGLNAPNVNRTNSLKTLLREELARVKSVIDIWILKREPKFLGPKISLSN